MKKVILSLSFLMLGANAMAYECKASWNRTLAVDEQANTIEYKKQTLNCTSPAGLGAGLMTCSNENKSVLLLSSIDSEDHLKIEVRSSKIPAAPGAIYDCGRVH